MMIMIGLAMKTVTPRDGASPAMIKAYRLIIPRLRLAHSCIGHGA